MRRVGAAAALCTAAGAASAQDGGPLRNAFDDPFFQITNAIAGCPVPAGPFMTEAERLQQSHHRAEKGTSCWLAGRCDKPNAYAYDRGIADALRARLRQANPVPDSSLWITVQGRIVYIEGCVHDAAAAPALEALARSVPDVEQAIAAVSTQPGERAPYRRLRP